MTEIFSELQEDDMTLLYSGAFADTVTSKIISLSNSYFESRPEIAKLHRKTGFLIAECFQNIVRHNESNVENGYFLSRNAHGNLFIASGNVIDTDVIPMLSDKLDHLNKLSKDELKEIYVTTLSNQQISEKGGAGLGLIEMARKTGNQLAYDFEGIANGLSYFYFQLRLELPQGDDGKAGKLYELQHTVELRKLMLAEKLFVVYKGDVSQETIVPMSNMIEQSMSALSDNEMHQKKAFIALIEMLQNMSKHGKKEKDRQDGMFALGEHEGRFVLWASNSIEASEMPGLKERLERLENMNLEDLNNEYKRVLKEGDPNNKKGSSLGLIEIARRSAQKPDYSFESLNSETYLFSIRVEI